jgi:hypothetical protein
MTDGYVKFARYAIPPNSLGYCGDSRPGDLVEMLWAPDARRDLHHALRQFTGATPHLAEIALENGRTGLFDYPVVEAYWVGNHLLRQTDGARWAHRVESRQRDSAGLRLLSGLFEDSPSGTWQHHSFQVFKSMQARPEFTDRLYSMDQCRIGWGRIERIGGDRIHVRRRPLIETRDGICLGPAEPVALRLAWPDLALREELSVGDWVSTHWGWVCERLTTRDLSNLAAVTRHNLRRFWPAANPDPGVAMPPSLNAPIRVPRPAQGEISHARQR